MIAEERIAASSRSSSAVDRRRRAGEDRAAQEAAREDTAPSDAYARVAGSPAEAARADDIVALQRSAGNGAVAEVLERRARKTAQRRKEPGEGSSEGGYLPGMGELLYTEKLSGAHWKKLADDKWGGATPNIAELESGFGSDLTAFMDMLRANNIVPTLTSGYRPPERSYLFHWCLKVANGKVKPKDVPAMDGVDIIWDHGNDADSRKAAKEMAKVFKLVGVAALRSNHNSGKAVDMVFNFSGNPSHKITYQKGGKTITRTLKIGDEAVAGKDHKGAVISNIAGRELSKAGADFGVKRDTDNDIVHWSRTGH